MSFCESFPTLFDLVDESETMEGDGVAKADFMKVADQCYLCDLCYMTKCSCVPPHEWNVDFPHLMLRAKAVNFRENGASFRDRLLTGTDAVAKAVSIPLVDVTVSALNRNSGASKLLSAVRDIFLLIPFVGKRTRLDGTLIKMRLDLFVRHTRESLHGCSLVEQRRSSCRGEYPGLTK